MRKCKVQTKAEGFPLELSEKSSTGYKGVHYHSRKEKKPYVAEFAGKYLSYHASAVEAAVAYAKHKATLAEAEATSEAFTKPPTAASHVPPKGKLPTTAEGFELELSERNATGYAGVTFLRGKKETGRNKPYQAMFAANYLGNYASAVEAAVAYAKHKATLATEDDTAVVPHAASTRPKPNQGQGSAGADAIELSIDDAYTFQAAPKERPQHPQPPPAALARAPAAAPGRAPARIATAQGIEPGPILVNCPRVLIGKFDAGATQVSFDAKHISFMLGHPTPASEQYMFAHLPVTEMIKFEVDKSRGTLCFWGMWDLPFAHELDDLYKPFVTHHEPESSIFMEFDKKAYTTCSGDEASRSWPKKILAVNPKFKSIVRFTDGHPGRVVLQPRLSGTAASSSAASAPAPAPAPAPAASWAEALNGASGVAAGSVGLAGSSSRDSLGSAPSVRGFGRLLADSAPAAAPSGAAAKRPAPAPAPAPAAKKKAKAQPTANDVVIDLDSD